MPLAGRSLAPDPTIRQAHASMVHIMAQIPGSLIVDLHPNGTVRMVFLPRVGDRNASPLIAKNLDEAELDFINTCGLTIERAAALRAEVTRNGVATVETSIDEGMVAKFRFDPAGTR